MVRRFASFSTLILMVAVGATAAETIPELFQKMKDPLAPVFRKGIDLASALRQVEKMLAERARAPLD